MGEARLRGWVGWTQELADTIRPFPVRGLSATLNRLPPTAAGPRR